MEVKDFVQQQKPLALSLIGKALKKQANKILDKGIQFPFYNSLSLNKYLETEEGRQFSQKIPEYFVSEAKVSTEDTASYGCHLYYSF